MGLMDFVKGQFIEIIEWAGDSQDTLPYQFPDEDREIKRGAQLIVREGQAAQFVYLGQFGDLFKPGKYALTTDNFRCCRVSGARSTASSRRSRRTSTS
jgi:membrane protease subunit (stomatin/prohibitin family)